MGQITVEYRPQKRFYQGESIFGERSQVYTYVWLPTAGDMRSLEEAISKYNMQLVSANFSTEKATITITGSNGTDVRKSLSLEDRFRDAVVQEMSADSGFTNYTITSIQR